MRTIAGCCVSGMRKINECWKPQSKRFSQKLIYLLVNERKYKFTPNCIILGVKNLFLRRGACPTLPYMIFNINTMVRNTVTLQAYIHLCGKYSTSSHSGNILNTVIKPIKTS